MCLYQSKETTSFNTPVLNWDCVFLLIKKVNEPVESIGKTIRNHWEKSRRHIEDFV